MDIWFSGIYNTKAPENEFPGAFLKYYQILVSNNQLADRISIRIADAY